MIFVGHTRFSVYSPNSGAWKASNGSRFKSQDEYRRYLFSDARLVSRGEILINFSLPQLARAAKGYEVTHLISYSEHLPKKYEDMLLDAAERYPFLVLDRQQGGVPHVQVEEIARGAVQKSDPNQPFGIYRLDDDDALPADYFAQNTPYLRDEYVGMQVSLGTGVSAIYKDGKFFNARKVHHPMLAIGYMSVHKFNEDGSMTKLPAVPHSKADRHYPVILDSRKLGYFWTRHTEQDTVLALVETDEDSRISSLQRHMDTHPAVHDMAELAEAFPYFDNKITSASKLAATREVLVPSPKLLPHAGLHLKPTRASGSFSVSTELTCDMNSVPRNALLSFIFVDNKGVRVDPKSLDESMDGQGLTRSSNASVGWFRYLGTKPGKNRTKIQFRLPDGIFVGAVRVLKWGRTSTSITVGSLSVEIES